MEHAAEQSTPDRRSKYANTANLANRICIEIRDFAVYLVVRTIICVIQSLTPRACERLSDGLAWFFGDVLKIRQSVVDDNLKHALPDRTAEERATIRRNMWRHLFRMICEIALAPRKIHESNWRDYVTIEGRRQLVKPFLDDRPLVAVTAHFGNFEMCGYISGLLGFPTYTIARTLDNRHLHKFLMQFRGATGQFVIPTKGTGELAQSIIKSKETLALLGDHFGGKKGCWVEFFNRPASCHKAIAVFSLANDAPLVVLYANRRERLLHFNLNCVGVFDPVIDEKISTIPDLTRWYNEHIENGVRKAPDQYWWLHRRWKDPRKKKPAIKLTAKLRTAA